MAMCSITRRTKFPSVAFPPMKKESVGIYGRFLSVYFCVPRAKGTNLIEYDTDVKCRQEFRISCSQDCCELLFFGGCELAGAGVELKKRHHEGLQLKKGAFKFEQHLVLELNLVFITCNIMVSDLCLTFVCCEANF